MCGAVNEKAGIVVVVVVSLGLVTQSMIAEYQYKPTDKPKNGIFPNEWPKSDDSEVLSVLAHSPNSGGQGLLLLIVYTWSKECQSFDISGNCSASLTSLVSPCPLVGKFLTTSAPTGTWVCCGCYLDYLGKYFSET